jgi:hypothetical protein
MSDEHPALKLLDEQIARTPDGPATLKMLRVVVHAFLVRVGNLEVADRNVDDRLTALEARPAGLKYCGVWTDGENYAVGDVTTRNGSMWVSKLNQNRSIPGADGGGGWTLAVKHGKDGKDGTR